jgi:23S rRNA pseudouridine2605 synthase
MPAPRRRPPSRAPSRPPRRAPVGAPLRVGLARALSKLGVCSRTEAASWIAAGRVEVDGRPARDPELRVDPARSRIRVDGAPARAAARAYWMMNKPRGLLTTRSDPRGRPTVYSLLERHAAGWIAPVGRLDQASEGLLLFSNDARWAAALLDPARRVPKTYHVQAAGRLQEAELAQLRAGLRADGELLAARAARLLRAGERNCWIEIVLVEGRNRQIRRMLEALGRETLRLVRVAIGPLTLGSLPKGGVRRLSPQEIAALAQAAGGRRRDRG